MMSEERYVLVIGSKPSAPLPSVSPVHIYTANAATSIAKSYINRGLPQDSVTCVSTGKQLAKSNVKEAVINTRPGCLVSRRWVIPNDVRSALNDKTLIELTDREQEDFQKKVLGNGRYYSELSVLPKMWKVNKSLAIKRAKSVLLFRLSGGLSTGLYSVLLAAENYPNHKIIVAGIGLNAGSHFDDKNIEFPLWRGLLDREMMRYLPEAMKQRLLTTDESFSEWVGVKMFCGERL